MDFARKKAILGCHGMVKTYVTFKFNELIFDSVFLSNLFSIQSHMDRLFYYYEIYSEEFGYKKNTMTGIYSLMTFTLHGVFIH